VGAATGAAAGAIDAIGVDAGAAVEVRSTAGVPAAAGAWVGAGEAGRIGAGPCAADPVAGSTAMSAQFQNSSAWRPLPALPQQLLAHVAHGFRAIVDQALALQPSACMFLKYEK